MGQVVMAQLLTDKDVSKLRVRLAGWLALCATFHICI